jgi:DNA-binding MarR family transcriptional regulator
MYLDTDAVHQRGGLGAARYAMLENDLEIPPRGVCNATAVRMASRKLSHLYDTALAPVALKATQFSLLAELGRRQSSPPTMKELARAMAMERSTLGQNMLPLEREGLVQQRNDTEDGRKRRLYLTSRGRDKLVTGLPLWENAQRRFEEVLGTATASELRDILTKIASSNELALPDPD